MKNTICSCRVLWCPRRQILHLHSLADYDEPPSYLPLTPSLKDGNSSRPPIHFAAFFSSWRSFIAQCPKNTQFDDTLEDLPGQCPEIQG